VTTISDLEIFARVARTGNMSAAGREMGLSPAVISKRISQLEEQLAVRLFQRTTRHLTLTETGAGYFKRVVDILSLCEEAEDFVSRRNTLPRGLLRVTAPTTFGRLHIAPYVGAFLGRYPEIEVDVQLTDAIVDIVRDGFDLAIRIGELKDSTLVARKIAPDIRVICATPAYLDARGTPSSLADLERHNCLSIGSEETWRLEGPDGPVQICTSGNVRSDSGEFIHEALCASLGLGLRPTWEVATKLKSGELQVVLPRYRGSSNVAIYAVYPCRDFMPAKVSVLIEFLAELYGPEPHWDRHFDLSKVATKGNPARANRKSGKSQRDRVSAG
jgi:DNA-binding transcriptional LysR family regulator